MLEMMTTMVARREARREDTLTLLVERREARRVDTLPVLLALMMKTVTGSVLNMLLSTEEAVAMAMAVAVVMVLPMEVAAATDTEVAAVMAHHTDMDLLMKSALNTK